jgi:hypothetical protein
MLLQGKGSVKERYHGKEYTGKTRIVGRVVFYTVPCRIKGKEAISSSQNFLSETDYRNEKTVSTQGEVLIIITLLRLLCNLRLLCCELQPAKRIHKVSVNKSDRSAQVRALSASPERAIDPDQ